MKTAIMSAMHEEINRIIKRIKLKNKVEIGRRTYYEGEFNGHDVVVVFSHWGKVAAAATATTLILNFNVDKILFTGVAGGIAEDVNIGDVVIGRKIFQHDMDSSPMIPKYEIPLLGSTYIQSAATEITKAYNAAQSTLKESLFVNSLKEELVQFNIIEPKIIVGDIASGDEFVSDTETRNRILHDLPSVVCVEMEGAAVAQVCNDFNIPFVIIRTISDAANEHSPINFSKFIEKIASIYSESIIEKYFEKEKEV